MYDILRHTHTHTDDMELEGRCVGVIWRRMNGELGVDVIIFHCIHV